jgi:hypothetical protein
MKILKGVILAGAVASLVFLLQGCYEERVVMLRGELIPMSQQDVVAMAQGGAPNSEIIREIRESGTVFRLSANDVENLKKEGVAPEVIDFMLSTREARPAMVERTVVVRRPTVAVYDPWWTWDYMYMPSYYYYPSHVGLSFSYTHFGHRARRYGYGVHFGHWR